MANKSVYRKIYNLIKSRRLRVLSLKVFEMLHQPFYRIGMDTNNLCNLKCIMCYMSLKDYKPKREIMSIKLFETIAKQMFRKVKFLDLSCGFEPFMTKNFLDYARIARKYCNGHIAICTNGLLMKDKIIKDIIKEDLLDEINISIDGVSDSTYNSIRANGKFADLVSVLESIKKQKGNKDTPLLRMNCTMLRENIEELKDIYGFVEKYDFKTTQLRHAKLTKPFSGLFDESLFYHQDLSDSVIKKIKKDFEKDTAKSLICPPLFSEEEAITTDKTSCAYPWFNFIISQ